MSLGSRFVYAAQSNSPDALVRGGVTYACVKDHLGSVRLVVNAASGVVAQRLDYDAWGVVTQDTAPGFQPFAYAGGVLDADTGFLHFGFRDYDAASALWTARDPIRLRVGGGRLSLEPLLRSPEYLRTMAHSGFVVPTYAYAANNPVHYVDRDGRDVTNGTNHTIWIKPERNGEPAFPLGPGQTFVGQQDGFADPINFPGSLFKTVRNMNATLKCDGTVSTSGGDLPETVGQFLLGGWHDGDWLVRVGHHSDWADTLAHSYPPN